MRERGFGTKFRGTIGNVQVVFVTYAFVDGTDLVNTAKNECKNGHHVMYQMKEVVDLWSGFLCTKVVL